MWHNHRPKGSVVDYVNAAYSLTNTAELEFCWGDSKIYETTYLTQAHLTEEACSLSWLISKQNWQDVLNSTQLVAV